MNDPIHRSSAGISQSTLLDTQDPQEALKSAEGAARAGVAGQPLMSTSPVPMARGAAKSASASRPDLPPVNNDKVDWSKLDGQSILAILGLEQNQRGVETAEGDIKLTMKQQKDAADQRLKEIENAIKKAEEARAKENSFWTKFFKVLGSVASVVGSVASFALGAMLTATGVGSVVGVILMAHSVSTLASTVMETLISTGVIDDPGWRPTIASGVAKLLEACNVDPKVAAIIGMVVEIAVVLAANVSAFMSIRSHVKDIAENFSFMGSKFASEMASKAGSALTLGRTGRVAEIGGSTIKAGSDIGSQAINLEVADLKFESDQANARAEQIKALTARLAKNMQMDMDAIQTLIKRLESNTEAVSDTVRESGEASKAVAANISQSA
jgi:uncharacterized membrane protein